MGVRFYASAAPDWWRFQLVSLANQRLPVKRPRFYALMVDNGMFAYAKEGRRPPLDRWFRDLLAFLHDVRRRLAPLETVVILPDWVWDPGFVLEAARHPMARRICTELDGVRCAAVAWAARDGTMRGYARTAEELAAIDWVSVVAAPLKIYCSRFSPRAGRRIILAHCQLAITEQVCGTARAHGLPCHALAVKLSPQHVKRVVELGASSFDTSSWTRPNNSVIAKTMPWSAKTKTEKEAFFSLVVKRLEEAGVELEK